MAMNTTVKKKKQKFCYVSFLKREKRIFYSSVNNDNFDTLGLSIKVAIDINFFQTFSSSHANRIRKFNDW